MSMRRNLEVLNSVDHIMTTSTERGDRESGKKRGERESENQLDNKREKIRE